MRNNECTRFHMQSSNMEVDWIEAEMIHLTPDVASTVAQINN